MRFRIVATYAELAPMMGIRGTIDLTLVSFLLVVFDPAMRQTTMREALPRLSPRTAESLVCYIPASPKKAAPMCSSTKRI
jgi:hypothetical protein